MAICSVLGACGGGGGGGGGESSAQTSSSAISDGSVTLNWEAPLYREDGTPIHPDDIDTYTIKFKKVGDSSYQTLVTSGNSDSIEIGINSPGEYEFIISATDASGEQSVYTDPIYSTIV